MPLLPFNGEKAVVSCEPLPAPPYSPASVATMLIFVSPDLTPDEGEPGVWEQLEGTLVD